MKFKTALLWQVQNSRLYLKLKAWEKVEKASLKPIESCDYQGNVWIRRIDVHAQKICNQGYGGPDEYNSKLEIKITKKGLSYNDQLYFLRT